MKKLTGIKIVIILIITLSSCSILHNPNVSITAFKNSSKLEYTKIITYSDEISTEEVSGIIYLHDHHLLIKGSKGFTSDIRFDLIAKTNQKIVNGKSMNTWKAHPYQSKQQTYIEYKEGSYLLIRFPKNNKAYLYTKN